MPQWNKPAPDQIRQVETARIGSALFERGLPRGITCQVVVIGVSRGADATAAEALENAIGHLLAEAASLRTLLDLARDLDSEATP